MTVKDLKERLKNLPDNVQIGLSWMNAINKEDVNLNINLVLINIKNGYIYPTPEEGTEPVYILV